MKNKLSPIANAKANLLIYNYGITAPFEINLEAIACGQGIIIQDKPIRGCEGRLLRKGKNGIIVVKQDISSPQKRRFIIAHELGHFELEKNESTPINICDESAFINWHKNGQQENDANVFASTLLFPQNLFNNFCYGKEFSRNLVIELARYFDCSLSATAMRYADIGNRPIAVVFSQNKYIKWYKCNTNFPFHFMDVRTEVDTRSSAYDFYKNGSVPPEPEEIPADVWFKNDYQIDKRVKLLEQNISFKNLNAVLSFIWEH